MRLVVVVSIAAAVVVGACLALGPGSGSDCAAMAVVGCSAAAAPLRAGLDVASMAATILAALGVVAFGVQARQHRRLAGSLARTSRPRLLGDVPVAVVEGLAAPAVAGLFRPTIFWPDGLERRLADRELTAVLLHERHHQRAFAPARLAALTSIEPVVGLSGFGQRWLERRRADIEIAADAYAIQAGAGRSDLARALLRLDSEPTAVAIAGYGHVSDLRLLHLLGDAPPPKHEGIAVTAALVVVVGLIACGAMAIAA